MVVLQYEYADGLLMLSVEQMKICIHYIGKVCVRKCRFKTDSSIKEELQILHLKGFSRVCVLKCLFKVDFTLKEELQNSQ